MHRKLAKSRLKHLKIDTRSNYTINYVKINVHVHKSVHTGLTLTILFQTWFGMKKLFIEMGNKELPRIKISALFPVDNW